MRIALLHGWGLDGAIWDRVLPLLAGHDCAVEDRGYFGPPTTVDAADLVVGHSLGALRALLAPPSGARALLALNGFDRFAAAPDFPAGTPPRVLDRMLARLTSDSAGVVADFRARSGAPPASLSPDAARLAEDLVLLRDADGRQRWQGPFARLDGADDPILSPAHRAACFTDHTGGAGQVLTGHGHLLPLTAPEACAAAILSLAERLA